MRVQSRRNFHTLVARAAPIVVPSLLVGEGIERFSRNDDGEEVGVPPSPVLCVHSAAAALSQPKSDASDFGHSRYRIRAGLSSAGRGHSDSAACRICDVVEEALVPAEGFEPPTPRLRSGCSTTELRRQNRASDIHAHRRWQAIYLNRSRILRGCAPGATAASGVSTRKVNDSSR